MEAHGNYRLARICRAMAATVLLALVGSSAKAQLRMDITQPPQPIQQILPFGFGHEGPSGSSLQLLLQMPDVHQDLGLDAQQRSQISNFFSQHRSIRKSLVENTIQGKVFSEPVDGLTVRRIIDKLNAEFETQLTERVLTSSQATRLQQISLQLEGIYAVYNPKIAKDLGLRPSQMQKLRESRGRISLQNGVQVQGDVNVHLESLLDTSQLAKLDSMQGAPFPLYGSKDNHSQQRLKRATIQETRTEIAR